jgi:flavorubredoxin
MARVPRQSGTADAKLQTSKGVPTMTKVLVLYYSSYGHTERMAEAVAGWQ